MSARRASVLLVWFGLSGCYSPDLEEDEFQCLRPGECVDGGVDGGVEQIVKIYILVDGAGLGSIVSESNTFDCVKTTTASVSCGPLEVATGDNVRLAAAPDLVSESSFKAFEGCDSTMTTGTSAGTCDFVAGSVERTIRATFGYSLRVGVAGEPASIESVIVRGEDYLAECGLETPCQGVFAEFEVVTIRAERSDVGRVAEWVGCDAGPGEEVCAVTMSQRQDVTVIFADASCGDGMRGQNNQCDDGNLESGDGCSSACEVEPGYACEDEPSVCTGFVIDPSTLAVIENMTTTFTVAMNRARAMDMITVRLSSSEEVRVVPELLTFSAGILEQEVTVEGIDDTVNEPDKQFAINFGSIEGDPFFAEVTIPSIIGTKLDDDDEPLISIAPSSASEGDLLTFDLQLSHPSEFPVSVVCETLNNTAVSGEDYSMASRMVEFAPLETQARFSVITSEDFLDEANETFRVSLNNPVGGTIDATAPPAVGTVNDDDDPPSLSIGNVTVIEGTGANVTAMVTVTLSPVSGRMVSVDWSLIDATAVRPSDYLDANDTLTFMPGEVSKLITATIVGDTEDEANETFEVRLASAVNANIGDGTGVVTIQDDDLVSLFIGDRSISEPDSGATNLTFTVSLAAVSSDNVTVEWAAVSGTATGNNDFVPSSGIVSIPAGSLTGTLNVPVIGDTILEGSEQFTVVLSNAVNATIVDNAAVGTINNDDVPPVASIAATASVMEGTGAAVNASIMVTLSSVSELPAVVRWSTANGTATAPGDYTSVTNQSLTIPAGSLTGTILVSVAGDTVNEAAEDFDVNLIGGTDVTINASNDQGTITITDDDAPPVASIAATAAVTEGTGGSVNASITVTLSAAAEVAAIVRWSTVNLTAGAPGDYAAVTNQSLTIPAGSTTGNIQVVVIGDTVNEAAETFRVDLIGGTEVTISATNNQGTITITDNDAPPVASIATTATVNEGTGAAVNAQITVTLSVVSEVAAIINFSTANMTASAPGDFTAATNQSLTIPAGSTTGTIQISVAGDTLDEDNETFRVDLISGTDATISTTNDQSTVTILDNDPLPALSIADGTIEEPTTGTGMLTVNVTLTPASGRTVTVDWTTAAGSAIGTGGARDYLAANGILTFTAGQMTRPITIVIEDGTDPTETFFINLSGATNADISDSQAIITITAHP